MISILQYKNELHMDLELFPFLSTNNISLAQMQ